MTKRKRRNHTAGFKAKVALEALSNDHTLAEIAEKHDVHPNQIQRWKNMLTSGADEVFGEGEKIKKDTSVEIDKLHAKIGQLTMERDFLAKAFGR